MYAGKHITYTHLIGNSRVSSQQIPINLDEQTLFTQPKPRSKVY